MRSPLVINILREKDEFYDYPGIYIALEQDIVFVVGHNDNLTKLPAILKIKDVSDKQFDLSLDIKKIIDNE